MPYLNINGADLDNAWVYAAMAYPNNQASRDELITVTYYRNSTLLNDGQQIVAIPADHLSILVAANSHTEVTKRAASSAGPGSIVGEILHYIVAMKLAGHPEPSLRKAIYLAEFYNKDAANSFGKKPAATDIGIRNYWNEYRIVAHLWAAHRSFFLNPHSPYYEAEDCMFDPFTFRLFLAVAEWYRNIGENCIAIHTKVYEPILPPDDMWKVPLNFALPSFYSTQDSLPVWMEEHLATYAKRNI